MKNLHQKTILMVFALFCGLFMFSSKVSASTYYSGDWKYSSDDNSTATLTDYYGSQTTITIPSQIDGRTVTTLGYGLFEYNDDIQHVILPSTITTIESYVFYDCDNLKSVTLPKSVTDISYSMFSYYSETVIKCYKYSTAYYYAIEKDLSYSLLDPYLSYSKTSATVSYNTTLSLPATKNNFKTEAVTYKSSNTSVATVNGSGLIKATGFGTATITATSIVNGQTLTATCKITVPAAALSLSPTSSTLKIGKTVQLVAKRTNFTGQTIKYTSNNTKVATVNANGLVNAKQPGKATITAKTTVGGKTLTATCTITVSKPSLNYTTYYLYKSESFKLKVKSGSGTVTYKSSNPKIATVDKSGKVVAKKKGNAKITAKSNGVTLTCKVYVLNPSLSNTNMNITKGFSQQLYVYGKSGKTSFSSSNSKIATVNSKGKITGKSIGKCNIVVKTNGITLKCKVSVVANSTKFYNPTSLDDISFNTIRISPQKLYFDGKNLKLDAFFLNRTYYKFSKFNYLTIQVYSNGGIVAEKTFYNYKLNSKSYSKKKLTLTLANNSLYKSLDLNNTYVNLYYNYNYAGCYTRD